MRQPGALLASGRDSEIFDFGPGLVLRRSRSRRSMEKEAATMRYVTRRGYPAPRVEEVSTDGSELVMERIVGATMLEDLQKRPWTYPRHAATLASLHERLHELPAPTWLDAFPGGGSCLVHLDLHPLNVILAPAGPVLIDWTNAARGSAATDVAVTWLLMAAAEIPGPRWLAALNGIVRRVFVRSFLRHFDRAGIRAALPAVVDWKSRDRNIRPAEVAAMRRLLHEETS
jgi:aminoglycoside phosphotransferase (APT) family kinase protein